MTVTRVNDTKYSIELNEVDIKVIEDILNNIIDPSIKDKFSIANRVLLLQFIMENYIVNNFIKEHYNELDKNVTYILNVVTPDDKFKIHLTDVEDNKQEVVGIVYGTGLYDYD